MRVFFRRPVNNGNGRQADQPSTSEATYGNAFDDGVDIEGRPLLTDEGNVNEF